MSALPANAAIPSRQPPMQDEPPYKKAKPPPPDNRKLAMRTRYSVTSPALRSPSLPPGSPHNCHHTAAALADLHSGHQVCIDANNSEFHIHRCSHTIPIQCTRTCSPFNASRRSGASLHWHWVPLRRRGLPSHSWHIFPAITQFLHVPNRLGTFNGPYLHQLQISGNQAQSSVNDGVLPCSDRSGHISI